MMYTVFIAGSISIKALDETIRERIGNILRDESRIIVGDADGIDRAVQQQLDAENARSVVVYCSGATPRNNVGGWPVVRVETDARPGTKAFYTAKDVTMADQCEYGLMIWDMRSTGTLKNTIELLKRHKRSLVYIPVNETFLTVENVDDFERLLRQMSDTARANAEKKLGLQQVLASTRNPQTDLFTAVP